MIYSFKKDTKNNIEIYNFYENNIIISVKYFLELIRNNKDFIIFLTNTLKQTSFNAYYLECSLIKDKQDDPVFIILIKTSNFSDETDYNSYNSYFDTNKSITKFFSLSNKNILIVPHPFNKEKNQDNWKKYRILSSFLEHAPKNKIIKFWKLISKITLKLFDDNKDVYYKTHGRDVPYLHFKIQTSNYNFIYQV